MKRPLTDEEKLRKEILGWMNYGIPRGKTIPIFEDLLDRYVSQSHSPVGDVEINDAYKAGQSDLIYKLGEAFPEEALEFMDEVIMEAHAIAEKLQALSINKVTTPTPKEIEDTVRAEVTRIAYNLLTKCECKSAECKHCKRIYAELDQLQDTTNN